MKVRQGTLVYIPANVRLIQESPVDEDISIKNYFVTEKPAHCLVVGSDDKVPVKKFNIIYKGTTWSVRAKDVYEIQKESTNASEAS